jgi:hypothetical protein
VLAGQATGPLDEDRLGQGLSTAGAPPVDVIVRTSGEQRLSNFLLWEAAYAELVYQDILWPDYGAEALADVIEQYRNRDRRFGGRTAWKPRPPSRPADGVQGPRHRSQGRIRHRAGARCGRWLSGLGGLWFLALMLLACSLLAVEWAMMSAARAWRVDGRGRGLRPRRRRGGVACRAVVAGPGACWSSAPWRPACSRAIAGRRRWIDAAYGVFYLGWPLVLLVWLRLSTDGGSWMILLFAVTWASDVFAYLIGSLVADPSCGRASRPTRPGPASSAA